jgi:hypothetical protein
MCLIISGAANKVRSVLLNTPGMLSDIFSSNEDGIGYMYGSKKGLKVVKSLPKNLQQATDFIQRIPNDDRAFAIHFRMTTHGHTDLDNCHPYDVVPGYMAMMHNGIFSTGNAADRTKSDTWHFINDYMGSPIREFPELAYNESYLTMVAEMVGNNRFVFMNGEGRISHVNFDQGIEYAGLWFSNTYAWMPSILIPSYRSTKLSTHRHPTKWDDADDARYYGHNGGHSYGAGYTASALGNIKPINMGTRTPRIHEAGYKESDYDFPLDEELQAEYEDEKNQSMQGAAYEMSLLRAEFAEHVEQCHTHDVAGMLEDTPYVLDAFMAEYYAVPFNGTKEDDFNKRDAALIHSLYTGDVETLLAFLVAGGDDPETLLAEVMCYYVAWNSTATAEVAA